MNDTANKSEDKPEDGAKQTTDGKGVARSYVNAGSPGSEFDTREMPAVPDDETESFQGVVVYNKRPGSVADTDVIDKAELAKRAASDENESIPKVVVDSDRPGSSDETIVASKADTEARKQAPDAGETVQAMFVDTGRPGSADETYVGKADEFETVNDGAEDDDEDATAMVRPRKDPFDDLETREVPALKDEWHARAAEVASDWGDEEGVGVDSSLAASVAAASGEVPLPSEAEPGEVAGPVLAKARIAQQAWARLRFEQRMDKFDALRGELVNQRNDYVPSLATAIGRPMVEALTGEYLPVLEALNTLDDIVPPLLVEQYAAAAPSTHNGLEAVTRPTPYGVVLIANSASAPFALPMTLAIDALATGNAVLICGAEHHPRVNESMRRMFSRAGFPDHLLQVVGGDSETLRVLLDARPDKVFIDGDDDTTARVAARCAALGTELHVLRRAKDMAIVLKGADLQRAVAGVLSAAYAGGGLRHGAVERVVVEDAIYDEFRMNFIDAIRTMNSHHAQLAAINDTYNPRRAQMLLDDAVAHGARVTYPSGEEPGRWIHWKALVIESLPDKAALSTSRLEGPGCALYRAEKPVDEAARLVGLMPANNISVFGEPGRDAQARLEELPASRIAFGDVFMTGGGAGGGAPLACDIPRGLCGPAAMLRPKIIASAQDTGRRIAWFPYTDDKAYALMDAMESMYGTEAGKRIKAAFKLALNPSKRRLLRGED